ncbi:MAG: hypothetical protein KOO63_03635 [Bacteroidales bacterium]|nr:hypothetical protein [Candidatus Latescibacterota bacterium]
MNTQMQIEALSVIRPFIQSELEDMGPNWWTQFVLPHLSHRNQDCAWRLGPRYIAQMDLAEALWVLKGNWGAIADRYSLERRYYGLLAHLRYARNAYAHSCGTPREEWEVYDRIALELLSSLIRKISRDHSPN